MIRLGTMALAILALLLAAGPVLAQGLWDSPQLPSTWTVREKVGQNPVVKLDLKPDPARSAALNRQGLDLASRGELDRAAGTLLQAVLYNRDNPEAWNSLGVVLQRMGRLSPAIKAYTRAIALQPRYAGAFRNLGSALEATRQPGLAAHAYRDYCRLAPGAPDAGALAQRAAWLAGQAAGR